MATSDTADAEDSGPAKAAPAPAAIPEPDKDSAPQLAAFPPDFEPTGRDEAPGPTQPPAPTPPVSPPNKPARVAKERGAENAAAQSAPTKSAPNDVPAFSSRRNTSEPAADAPTGPLPNETIAPRIQVTAATPVAQPPEQVHVPVTAPTVDGGAAPSGLKADKRPAASSKKRGTKGGEQQATGPSEKTAGKQLLAGARKKVKAAAGAATAVGALGRSKAEAQNGPSGAAHKAPKAAHQAKPATATRAGASNVDKQRAETEAMTIFGARSEAQVGGKPKYLGLALVLGLVLLMGVLAVWSVFFLSDETSELFPDQPDQFESAITTGNSAEQDADVANADLIEDLPEDPAAQAQDASEGARTPLSPEAAMTRYAATGVWERAPDPLQDPDADQLQDLYIASIDPATHGLDAVALPPGQIDRLLPGVPGTNSRRAPPPKGTVFELDENGWVRPTPEGSLTPEGVMVFAGRPESAPLLAPEGLFPDAPEVTPEEANETVAALQPPANSPRPRLRPAGLIEQSERALYGGFTRDELAANRPKLRPKILETRLAAAEAQQANAQASAIASAVEGAAEAAAASATASLVSPTELAVTRSATPKPRPRQFDRIIAKAPAPEDDSDGSVVVAAAPRNQTVTPKLPTRASVAKQATVKNAIPLRKVALIGIFGSNAKRKALVRLSNGRYVKVGVGDRLDGGRVVSISDSKLIYKKGSRNRTLKILPFS